MGRWRRCSGWLVYCVEGGAALSPMVSETPGDQMQTCASSEARVPEARVPEVGGLFLGRTWPRRAAPPAQEDAGPHSGGLWPTLHRRQLAWAWRGLSQAQTRPAEWLRGSRTKLRAAETTAGWQGDGVLSAVGFCTLALVPGDSLISKNPGPASLKEALFCV